MHKYVSVCNPYPPKMPIWSLCVEELWFFDLNNARIGVTIVHFKHAYCPNVHPMRAIERQIRRANTGEDTPI